MIESHFGPTLFRVSSNFSLYGVAADSLPAGTTPYLVTILGHLDAPKDYVTFAAGFARHYHCRIIVPVAFLRHGPLEGIFAFVIACDGNTSSEIHRYGKSRMPGPMKPSKADLDEYRERFGTDEPKDPDFVKEYWFSDPFSGNILRYDNPDEAVEMAKAAHGNAVTVWTNRRYATGSEILTTVKGLPPLT